MEWNINLEIGKCMKKKRFSGTQFLKVFETRAITLHPEKNEQKSALYHYGITIFDKIDFDFSSKQEFYLFSFPSKHYL